MMGLPALLGGLGLVAVAFGLLSALLVLFQPVQGPPPWILGNLAVGVLLLSAALFIGFDNVRARLRSGEAGRVGRYGSSAVLSTVIVIAILAMLGFLAQRHSVRFDWSESGVNTLTEQTRDLLARLEGQTTLTAFFERSEVADVTALLDLYAYESDRVEVEYVDPNSVPLMVEELGLDPDALARGLVRIERDGVGMVVTELTESGITNGLLKLARGSEKKIYFITGHNERRIVGDDGEPAAGRDEMGRAADALRNETYRVEALEMATRGEIPEDADAVVVAGPTRPYYEHEIGALRAYAEGGGAILVLIDPRAQTNLYELLEEWGVTLGDDVVVDRVQAIFNQATMPLAGEYSAEHPITRSLRQTTLYPMVRSVEIGDGDLETIVWTGSNSWAERDLDGWQASGRAEYDARDLAGPVPIAAASRPPDPVADDDAAPAPRLVVFGDSDFASNEFIEAQFNRDLFLNTANWLVGDTEQITIRPRLSRASRFELDASQFQAIVYLSLFVLPEGIAVAGVVAWWLRRGRGRA